MKKTTIISVLVHVGLLGALVFFGTRELRSPKETSVEPSEVIDNAEFEARKAGNQIATVPETPVETQTPSQLAIPEEVDSVEALRQRIAEEMRRREEDLLAAREPVEGGGANNPAPKPQAPKPAPKPVVTKPVVPPVGDSAPRTAMRPPARGSVSRVDTAAPAASESSEINALVEQVTVTALAESAGSGIIPPTRGASADNNIAAPSTPIEVAPVENLDISGGNANAPKIAIKPPSRVASEMNSNIDALVSQVVESEPEKTTEISSDDIDNLVQIAQNATAGTEFAPRFASRPPSR